MTVKKELVDDGDPMPCHMENILNTKVIEMPMNGPRKLEIWYREPGGMTDGQ